MRRNIDLKSALIAGVFDGSLEAGPSVTAACWIKPANGLPFRLLALLGQLLSGVQVSGWAIDSVPPLYLHSMDVVSLLMLLSYNL